MQKNKYREIDHSGKLKTDSWHRKYGKIFEGSRGKYRLDFCLSLESGLIGVIVGPTSQIMILIPIFVDYEITATYDMEFPVVDQKSVKRATAREVPELPAFTLCFWIRLPRGYTRESPLMYPLIEYRGSKSLYIGLVGQESDPKMDFIFDGGGKQWVMDVIL